MPSASTSPWFWRIIYTLLFLECLWAILWTIAMFLIQFDDAVTQPMLFDHFFLVLHAFMPSTLLAVFELHKRNNKRETAPALLFWMAFVVITDLNSVLQTFLHLSVGPERMIALIRATAVVQICLSGLGSFWYSMVLFIAYFSDDATASSGGAYAKPLQRGPLRL